MDPSTARQAVSESFAPVRHPQHCRALTPSHSPVAYRASRSRTALSMNGHSKSNPGGSHRRERTDDTKTCANPHPTKAWSRNAQHKHCALSAPSTSGCAAANTPPEPPERTAPGHVASPRPCRPKCTSGVLTVTMGNPMHTREAKATCRRAGIKRGESNVCSTCSGCHGDRGDIRMSQPRARVEPYGPPAVRLLAQAPPPRKQSACEGKRGQSSERTRRMCKPLAVPVLEGLDFLRMPFDMPCNLPMLIGQLSTR